MNCDISRMVMLSIKLKTSSLVIAMKLYPP